ncbi:MAG: MFS transporter, partial [Gallionella sp.]|nr:MFS transporter [Gallionella sp.]
MIDQKTPTGAGDEHGRGRVRFLIVFMLFAVTSVTYADRASLYIVGPAMQS